MKYNKSSPGYAEFKYSNDPEDSHDFTNLIIKTLLEGQEKKLNDISIKFFYTINKQLHPGESSNYEGYIFFKGLIISGDVKYKNFSVSDVLIPSNAHVVVKILDNLNNTSQTFDLKSINVSEPNTDPAFSIPDTLLPGNFSIEVNIEKFFFSEVGKELFESRINAIRTYYSNDSILMLAKEKLKTIDPQNLDLIPLYNIWINELIEVTDKLEEQYLPNILPLELYDPIEFLSRSHSLRSEVKSLYSKLSKDLEEMEVIYYKKSLELLKQNQIDEAEEYLNKSLHFNTKYFPSHHEMAKLHFSKNNPDDAVIIISMIHESMDISENEHTILSELGENIIQHYLKTAESFILQDKNNEALEAISKAESFCKKIPAIDCPEEISDLKNRAKYGIFKSYLKIATKAMEILSFDFAERYIKKASEYQQNNKEAIESDAEIKNSYSKLIYNCTEKGFEALAIPDFNNAQNYFDHAYRLCNALDGFKCSQRLIDGINSANYGIAMEYDSSEYEENKSSIANELEANKVEDNTKPINEYDQSDHNRLISEGQILLEANHGVDAFEKLNTAKELEQKFNLTSYADLDRLISLSAKPVILSELKKSDFLIWQNRLDEADKIYTKAIDDQKKFKLSDDQDINMSLIRLQKKTEKKKCFNAESDYRNKCLKAMRHIRRGEIDEAGRSLEKADKIKDINTKCFFVDDRSKQLKKEFSTYFNYQKHMDMARAKAREKKYNDSYEQYQKSHQNFTTGQIDTIGLTFPDPIEFTSGYNDPEFSFYVCQQMLDRGDYMKAFFLLKDLRRLNRPSKETKEIQIKLGEEISKTDKKNISDPFMKIEEYTLGDEWYRYFRKAYLSTWKRLDE